MPLPDRLALAMMLDHHGSGAMLGQPEGILFTIPPQFRGPGFYRKGTMMHHRDTGEFAARLIEAGRFPIQQGGSLAQMLPALQAVGSVASVLNLGVSVASFAYMASQFQKLNRRLDAMEQKLDVVDSKLDVLLEGVRWIGGKVDAVGADLGALASRLDARRKSDILAEIGAVMDALAYADNKPAAEAKALVAGNLIPAKKALRLYGSFLDELEDGLAALDPARVETGKMRLLGAMLAIKLDLTLGETSAAIMKAQEQCAELEAAGRAMLGGWHKAFGLRDLAAEVTGQPELIDVLEAMQQIDGCPPLERMAAALLQPSDLPFELPEAAEIIDYDVLGSVPDRHMWASQDYSDAKVELTRGQRLRKGDEIKITSVLAYTRGDVLAVVASTEEGYVCGEPETVWGMRVPGQNSVKIVRLAAPTLRAPQATGISAWLPELAHLLAIGRGMMVETALLAEGRADGLLSGQAPFSSEMLLSVMPGSLSAIDEAPAPAADQPAVAAVRV